MALFGFTENKIKKEVDPKGYVGSNTVGSSKKPVYIKDGVPTAIGYEINKNIPSDALNIGELTLVTTTKTYSGTNTKFAEDTSLPAFPSGGTYSYLGIVGYKLTGTNADKCSVNELCANSGAGNKSLRIGIVNPNGANVSLTLTIVALRCKYL